MIKKITNICSLLFSFFCIVAFIMFHYILYTILNGWLTNTVIIIIALCWNTLRLRFTWFQAQSGHQLEPRTKIFSFLSHLHSSARLVGHPAVHSIFTADGDEVRQCFSADSFPEQPIERLHIPLTDVCDQCSSEIKWKQDSSQRFCIGFEERAGSSVERSSPHLAGWPVFLRQGVRR